jgi:hypothetical protein
MKRTFATRMYTFQELMNRLDMEYWRVHHHGMDYYTFVPVQYTGRG